VVAAPQSPEMATVVAGTVSKEEIEAVTEVDAASIASPDLDCAPAMNTSSMVKKRCCRAHEAASLSRAVARCVRACLAVVVPIIIGWPGCATKCSIWALYTNAFQQALHRVASAVAVCRDATHMTLAPGPELLVAHPTHHMPHPALQ
jgi:hypothetical protein